MKSVAIAAALLASTAVAQPHGHHRHHHAKRDLVTEWETVWETATVIIDDETTQTLAPASSGTPAQFFQPDTGSSYSTSSAAPVVESPTTQAQPSTPTTVVSIAKATTYSTSTQAPTSTYVAPTQPTTTAAPVTPSTSSTYSAVAPTSSASSGGSTGSDGIPYNEKFSGDITYYNAALGACGYEDTGKDDSTNIVAIPKAFWDAISTATSYGINQPAHPLCDKTITITTSDGKTTTATIRDRCDGCSGHAIDVTPHTFEDLFGSLDGGRLEASWVINE
ncbi:uncharacterized protein GGS22DRAFT_171686 [Annulohypoxylon maeteangense]|uniref:uncharacterized protein n=1 Tax=Annulohypoxylon maeteangense TaxID=1927788 RepID=UPI002008B247|nr:uncharacterized protein GGS22DRAFT_171686 [Annulohypoxylon maeteangense]KAI0881722.1 hypothetical protein GGS22DRAFT_171686 [Annulohypoxylon maeteangense]